MKILTTLLALTLAPVLTLSAQSPTPAAKPATEPHPDTHAKPEPAPISPLHTWRLQYTITQSENGKQVGIQHEELTLDNSGRNATIRLGSKIPIITGYSSADKKDAQVTYVDLGLNITAGLIDYLNQRQPLSDGALELITKVELSNVPDTNTPAQHDDPVIRQVNLQNTAVITSGESVRIGSLDLPDTIRHIDIDVTLERVH